MRVRVFLLAVLVMALLPAAASANYPHVVAPGETLTSVATADGLSIEAIAQANGISSESQLVTGQILWIPPLSAEDAAVATSAASSTSSVTSTAQDTTSAVVRTADVTSSESSEAESSEGESSEGVSTGSATTAQPSTASTTTGSSSTTGSGTASSASTGATTAGGPQPTAERASSGEIAYIANANGVPAALAEAIGWQESGWSNNEVSGVGAVGVMQIVPTTWDWIDRYLTPSNPLGTASAAENIRGGVLLLHQLLQLTGGDEKLAIAGYYQGLSSVQAHGMYADTRQYVSDVLALVQRFGG